jgi:hypothetical protein
MNKRGAISLFQILILFFGIIAIGNEIKFISSGEASLVIPSSTQIDTSNFDLEKISLSIKDVKEKIKEVESDIKIYEDAFKEDYGNDWEKNLMGAEKEDYFKLVGKKESLIAQQNNLEQLKINPTGSKIGNWLFKKGITNLGTSNFVGHIGDGLLWSMVVVGAIKFLGGFVTDDDELISALSSASFGGIMAGKGTYGLIKEGGWFAKTDAVKWINSEIPGGSSTFSIGVGAISAAIIFYNSYKKQSQETITFTCNPWDAPTGGINCEKCNEGNLPCSEYQCRSLGQSCELVNPETKESKCVWINKNDVKFPIITPWKEILTDGYSYSPDNTISPPDRGVKILKDSSNSKCVKAFEPLLFGITTDEPSKCKIDYLRKENFEDMEFYFGGTSTHKYNHTQSIALPGPSTTENGSIILQNNGNYELYVRCQDANGNYNKGNFVFKYCVEKGPDTTPTMIVTTNLLNNMPIAYNQTEIDLEIYINEPSECRWSHSDQDYSSMENLMSCASSVFEMNAQMLYKCSTTLDGLKNKQKNNFYFRCNDQPGKLEDERNTNAESYKFTLIGTQPLILSSVGPNKTIKDSTEKIKITLTARTDAGYNEGESNCYYSETGDEDSYIAFFNTGSYQHSQELYLIEGTYKYWIKCIDLGGNSDFNTTEFEVKTDRAFPLITRTFHEEPYLKLITNEQAECVYDIVNCNYLFKDGIKISTTSEVNHYLNWNTKTNLYIKCKDKYENQPEPNKCTLIARAFNLNFN